jgi:hypothetical protein
MKLAPTHLAVVVRYLSVAIPGHLVWEIAQLPLYTLWETETPRAAVMAAVHCTAGDFVIALGALALAVVLVGDASWPRRSARRVAVCTLLFGVAYTVFSEWLNTELRGSWSYSRLMPLVPPFGTGLSPLLQWVVVPVLALWWAERGSVGADARR